METPIYTLGDYKLNTKTWIRVADGNVDITKPDDTKPRKFSYAMARRFQIVLKFGPWKKKDKIRVYDIHMKRQLKSIEAIERYASFAPLIEHNLNSLRDFIIDNDTQPGATGVINDIETATNAIAIKASMPDKKWVLQDIKKIIDGNRLAPLKDSEEKIASDTSSVASFTQDISEKNNPFKLTEDDAKGSKKITDFFQKTRPKNLPLKDQKISKFFSTLNHESKE
jgi:hypothetical protein